MTRRFEQSYDSVLKIVEAFVGRLGPRFLNFGGAEVLKQVASLKIRRPIYKTWENCIGEFLKQFKGGAFFEVLPLELLNHDMNSQTFAQDSRSYLIPIIQKYALGDELHVFTHYILPLIQQLEFRQQQAKKESDIKAKKYETLIIQLWETLPNFCQNERNLDTNFVQIITPLENLVNKNKWGLRTLALRTFSVLIDFCRNTPKVTESIKKTRQGLQRICLDYVEALSRLYLTQHESKAESAQLIRTLTDFASIAKSGKLNNLFLTEFASLCYSANPQDSIKLDILLALMEKVKLKRENYATVMKETREHFIPNPALAKRGMKVICKAIERFEVQQFEELVAI